jgi:indolepyruvate ferredoxin oxidoreductase alpha subunit
MIQEAFELSEKYNTPVILRPTTRVDHAYESMDFPELTECRKRGEFEKDSKRWVIFPRASYNNHKRIFERNEKILPAEFSNTKWNSINPNNSNKIAFAAGGISYCYLMEALSLLGLKDIPVLKIGTPYPFPKPLAEEFLKSHEQIVVFEELDPVIEENLIKIAGLARVNCQIHGKLDGTVPEAGELSVEIIRTVIEALETTVESNQSSKSAVVSASSTTAKPDLPVRPPVLCAGCPHRGAFYAVKQAMKGKKTVYCGDIGCYTLGNAAPLDMCDTCLCMGADITMAQGFFHAEPDRKCFSFIGDSTFFASGITGVVNAVYNQAKITLCILDNSTTAMTGHQPHPGTGLTMMGNAVEKISMEKILEAVGVSPVITVDAFNLKETVEAVKKASEAESVSAVIFKGPCIAIAQKLGFKAQAKMLVDDSKCIGCKKCISELGCPAITFSTDTKKALIEKSLCTGCTLCSQVCPVKAIVSEGGDK